MNGMMPDIDPMELFTMMLKDAPVPELAFIATTIVNGMADRLVAEWPTEADQLKDAALVIEGVSKKVSE
jgi:hypothetical protein